MKRIVTSCPNCGKEIYEDHPYAWCMECGQSLPMEVQMRLPLRVKSLEAAWIASRPLDIVGMEPKVLAAIEALLPEAETGRRLFGGLANRNEVFLHIGFIPLYYNCRSHYVFFS